MNIVLCVSFCFSVYEKKTFAIIIFPIKETLQFSTKICVLLDTLDMYIATCTRTCQCDVVLDLFGGENGIP